MDGQRSTPADPRPLYSKLGGVAKIWPMCSGDGRKWQHTPVFLRIKSHGQRSLAEYSPQGCKESDITDQAHTHDGLNLGDRVLGEVERASLLCQPKGATVG